MKFVFGLLAAASLALVVAGLTFFMSPDNGNVSKEDLDQWYVLVTIVAAAVGGVTGLGAGMLVRRRVQSKAGETAAHFHNRVILRGFVSGTLAVALSIVIAIQLAYGKADWQLSPGERVGLVIGSGRFVLVPAAAWFLSALVFVFIISSGAWKGKNAFMRSR